MIPTWVTVFATIGILVTVCTVSAALGLLFGSIAKEFNPDDDEGQYHE